MTNLIASQKVVSFTSTYNMKTINASRFLHIVCGLSDSYFLGDNHNIETLQVKKVLIS